MENPSVIFGENCFDDSVMQNRLPKETYKALRRTIEEGRSLDPSLAGVIANAMKDWALEKGATHYTHWFQPMTGVTAEKHDSFIGAPKNGKVLCEFSGKELVCGETDGHVDLTDLMQQLGSAGINGILLEGGSSLAFSALKAGIVRRVQAYIAPKLIGGADAKSPVGGEGLAKMADALALKNVRSTPLGEDFLIEGRL